MPIRLFDVTRARIHEKEGREREGERETYVHFMIF